MKKNKNELINKLEIIEQHYDFVLNEMADNFLDSLPFEIENDDELPSILIIVEDGELGFTFLLYLISQLSVFIPIKIENEN